MKNRFETTHRYAGRPDWELLKKFVPFAEFMKFYHFYRVDGMKHIPTKGRAMILVNHSFATYDILLLSYTILDKLDRLPFGLADSNFYKNELIAQWMLKIGMLEANHENAEAVLAREEILMLAPGGTREAIRPKHEKYQIKWSDRKGFAKLAIKTQTPVILAACPGADNVYDVKPSPITDLAYKFFKFPLAFANGIGNTLLPRPVKLVHYIQAPLSPPAWTGAGEPPQDLIDDFHQLVVREMELLMETRRAFLSPQTIKKDKTE